MVGIKSVSLCWTLLFVCLLAAAAAAQVQKTITAESGDTVTLPCRAPNNRHITVVDWRRSGLTDKSVLLFRDNKNVSDEQDPSFKNRVTLQDVKDGDVSLILKNVTTHDTGIYECRVVQQTESHRRKRAVDPISIINLRVVQKTITANSGQRNVTLPCRAPNNRNITAVDWRRSGLTDNSVLLYRDNKYDPDEQDPSFKNRVALQDVKDGDVSLILKNVTTHDTGIYECRVVQQTESHRRKRAVDPISIINLRVVNETITANSGQRNVTLPCRAPNNRNITVVDWRRSGLTDNSVLLYRDNKYDPDEQDPSFKNRVALQDVKNGNVSLILKNVTTHDTGIYECRVDQKTESHRRKRAVDTINTINLRVVNETITANSGQRNVTLPCRAPNNRNITAVDWRRSGLTDKSVLLFRDNKYDPDEQDPSFKNRVALQDVKNGDVSLILKNVTTQDTGIYECRVVQQTESHRRKRAVDPISIIYLSVDPPGQTGGDKEDGGKEKEGSKGRSGPGVGLSVSAVLLLVAVVGFLIYRKHKQQQNQDSYQPPAEQQQL